MPILARGRSIAKLGARSEQGEPGRGLVHSVRGTAAGGGRASPCVQARRGQGFTLIEVMVTLLIASVVFGMAMLSLRSLDRSLQIEAQRVAQLLSFARDYAQMRGRAVRFEADESGYRFISRNQGDWALILDEPILRERVWDKPTQVRLERLGANPFSTEAKLPVTPSGADPSRSTDGLGRQATNVNAGNIIEFGRDYVDSPFTVWLSQSTQKVGIAANGLGKFEVQMEATQ
jgi:type II secretion system protein H